MIRKHAIKHNILINLISIYFVICFFFVHSIASLAASGFVAIYLIYWPWRCRRSRSAVCRVVGSCRNRSRKPFSLRLSGFSGVYIFFSRLLDYLVKLVVYYAGFRKSNWNPVERVVDMSFGCVLRDRRPTVSRWCVRGGSSYVSASHAVQTLRDLFLDVSAVVVDVFVVFVKLYDALPRLPFFYRSSFFVLALFCSLKFLPTLSPSSRFALRLLASSYSSSSFLPSRF